MFIIGFVLGAVLGLVIGFVLYIRKPDKYKSAAERLTQELKEIEDELRGRD